MKYLFSIILLFFSTSFLNAQGYLVQGIVGIEGGEFFSYDLNVNPSTEKNKFTGTVKTYAIKDKPVIAEVIVTYDPSDKSFFLQETKITNNAGFQSQATICLVQAKLYYDETKGVLKGPIITQTGNKSSYCATGNLIFTNRNEIEALLKQSNYNDNKPKTEPVDTPQKEVIVKKTSTKKPKVVVIDTIPSRPKPIIPKTPEKHKEITEGKEQTIVVNNQQISIEIYDDGDIDDDKVSIFFNGKEILTNYNLTKSPKNIPLDLGGSELNIISIKAMNYGSKPPNTAMIEIVDGNVHHKILAHNEPGKIASVRIKSKMD